MEVDGVSHDDQVEYDQARTEWLESQGLRLIRFSNREVSDQLEAVMDVILRECQERNRA